MPIATRRTLLAASVGVGATAMQSAPRLARAQAANTIRIGVLNDQSGLYRDMNGPGSVACVRQAIADSGVAARGFNVEVLVADHQNRPDVGVQHRPAMAATGTAWT